MAIKAAQLAMNGLKLSKTPETQKFMRKKSEYFLDEAQRIKSVSEWKPLPEVNVNKVTVLVEPKSDRKLPTSEQILLLRASQLNGFKFPPWTNPPQDSDFRLSSGQEPFT
jgi:calpain-7